MNTFSRAVATALVAAALVSVGCAGTTLPENDAAKAKPSPPIDVPRLDGSGRYTNASLKGKVTVVNFWASWCPPCRSEMPEIAEFARAHPEVRVLGIAVSDKPAASQAFAKKVNVGYDLGVARDGSLSSKFGVPGLPGTFVLNSKGDVARQELGEVKVADLEKLVEGVT
jgi:cytochrome c biogenesis protein CcmG/thiol:disulfide interchange protein DsbE